MVDKRCPGVEHRLRSGKRQRRKNRNGLLDLGCDLGKLVQDGMDDPLQKADVLCRRVRVGGEAGQNSLKDAQLVDFVALGR